MSGEDKTEIRADKRSMGFGWLSRLPSGRLTKWLVLAAWVVLVVLCVPLGSRLTDIQENEAVQFLPRGAEYTKVADLQEKLAGGEDPPTVVEDNDRNLTDGVLVKEDDSR